MKFSQLSAKRAILLLLCVSTGLVEAQVGQRLTREELIARRDAANERKTSLDAKEEAKAETHPSKSSILERSVILGSSRNWTFVPKGAVMILPETHKEKVNLAEGRGKYLPFAEFAAQNRGWLSVYSVTLDQARGKSPISEQERKKLQASGRVVISVCQGGPISTRATKAKATKD